MIKQEENYLGLKQELIRFVNYHDLIYNREKRREYEF